MKKYDTFDFPDTYCDIAMEYIDYKHSLGFKYFEQAGNLITESIEKYNENEKEALIAWLRKNI